MNRFRSTILCLCLTFTGCGRDAAPPVAQPPTPPESQQPPAANSEIVARAATEMPQEPEKPIVETPLTPQNPVVEPVFRPSDNRPQHAVDRALKLGVVRYESRRMVLYTDLPTDTARRLPPLVDALYEDWVRYFGELPPNREGSEYQITGYLMQDAERFRTLNMLPVDLPVFEHGRHLGLEFWMLDQPFDYYREHLLLHEATHCFMTTMPGPLPPYWYMEGMAEYFATHKTSADGATHFAVLPDAREPFRGFGGLQIIQQELEADRKLTATQVMQLGAAEFARNKNIPYAWSWWLCYFLNAHPRYQDRFQELGQHLSSREFARALEAAYLSDLPLLEVEWLLATRSARLGFDVPRSAIEFRPGVPLNKGAPQQLMLRADVGWQCTGVAVTAGDSLQVECAGRVALAQQPRPWDSEGQGISIRYAEGKPIGRLLGIVLPHVDAAGQPLPRDESLNYEVLDFGNAATIVPESSGTLYVRVNDHWHELADNTGSYVVTLSLP